MSYGVRVRVSPRAPLLEIDMKEYKQLTFPNPPFNMADEINVFAEDRWEVVAVVCADATTHVLLERFKDEGPLLG